MENPLELHRQLKIPIGNPERFRKRYKLLHEIVFKYFPDSIKTLSDEDLKELRKECSVSPSDYRLTGTIFGESFCSMVLRIVNMECDNRQQKKINKWKINELSKFN